MMDEYKGGVVYHIDMELIRKARERDLRQQIARVNEQAQDAQRDLMLIKTAETALIQVQETLENMRALAVEAATNPNADRADLNLQVDALKRKIDEIVKSSTFDGVNLLDGSMGSINSIIAAINTVLNNAGNTGDKR